MKRLSMMLTAVVALVAAADERAAAITAKWTGAKDNFWTNSANWADGVVPGYHTVVTEEGTEGVDGSRNDTAIFDGANFADATKPVTLDLSGLTSVKYITVQGATTPQITFGTSSEQKFYITTGAAGSFATAGRFTVTADAGHVPIIEAQFGFSGFHSASQCGSVVCNSNTTARLVLKKLAPRMTGNTSTACLRMYVTGCGDIEFADDSNPISGETRFQNNMTGGKLYFTGKGFQFRVMGLNYDVATTYPKECILAKDHVLCAAAGSSNGIECYSSKATFSGEGTLVLESANSQYGAGCTFALTSPNYCAEITCNLKNYYQEKCGEILFVGNKNKDCPEVTLHPANNYATGYIQAQNGILLDIDTAARLGENSLGVILNNYGKLRYSGAGEEIAKPLVLKGSNSDYLIHQGTGPLVYSGKVMFDTTAQEFVLANYVDSLATMASPLTNTTAKVTKLGSGLWKFTGELSYTGGTQMQQGRLQFAGAAVPPSKVRFWSGTGIELSGGEGAPSAVTISEIEINADAAAELKIAEGNTQAVTISKLTRNAGGTLNIVAPEGANITFAGYNSESNDIWLTWNGEACVFSDAGKVAKGYSAVVDVTIPVKGGIITNGATKVGIVTGGEEGNITLSADTTAVTLLAHKTPQNGTVALTAGQTLKVDELSTDTGAGALTIGTAAGVGTLAAKGTTVEIAAMSTNQPIEVKAKVDFTGATEVSKMGPGFTRLANAVKFTGTFKLNGGALAVTNQPSYVLNGPLNGGLFVKEGTHEWEPTVSSPYFEGDYAISNGLVRPSNGATVFGKRRGKLIVADGATLAINSEKIYTSKITEFYFDENDNCRTVHFAGQGVDGKGALRVEASNRTDDYTHLFGNVVLDDDAYFNWIGESSMRASVHYSNGSQATFDMGGHTLTLGGIGKFSFFNVTVANPGPIVLEQTNPTNKNGYYNEFLLYYGNNFLGDTQPITLETNAVLTLNQSNPQQRPIYVKGPATLRAMSSMLIGWDQDCCIWNGDITFDDNTAANKLTVNPNNDNPYARIAVNGKIQGPGDVRVGPQGGRVDFGNTNTFTGSLTMDGYNNAFLVAMWPEFVLSTCNVTVNYERISAPFTDGNGNTAWSLDQMYALANRATLTNGAVIAAFTRTGETKDAAISDATITREKSEDFGFGKDGPGTLNLTGTVTKPIRLAAFDGTLNVTGEDTSITVTNLLITSDRGWSTGRLDVANGGEIKIAPGGDILFGGYKSSTIKNLNTRARIAGKITQLDTLTSGCINKSYYGLTIGGQNISSTNIVEIVDGADIAARMSVCYVPKAPNERKVTVDAETQPVSAVYQTGGKVRNLGHSSNGGEECPYLGGAGAAYYKLSGGEYFSKGYFRWGCYTTFQSNSGSLVFEHDGGKFISETGTINIGNDYNAFLVYQSGGTAYCTNTIYWGFGSNANGAFVLTGPQTYCRLKYTYVGNQSRNRIGIVIRDGAVLETDGMKLVPSSSNNLVNRRYTFGFDGGVWQSDASSGLFKNTLNELPDSVTVYAGGAVFKTLKSNTMTVDAPLVAPKGQGVTAIALPEKFKKVAAPPAIAITGEDATMGGAVARCVYDRAKGEVTGIEMITTGHSYTKTPTVTVRLGADSVNVTPTMGAVAAGGGVTIRGMGTVAFACTNTYAGVTAVESGTLKCTVDYAVPSNGAVRVAGGTLDLNGKKAEFSSFECAGGTLAGASQLTLPGTWAIDVAAAYAGTYFTVPTGMTMPTTVTAANFSEVPAATKSFTVMKTTDTVTAVPTVANANDLPPAWQLYWVGNELKLGVPRGMRILFR